MTTPHVYEGLDCSGAIEPKTAREKAKKWLNDGVVRDAWRYEIQLRSYEDGYRAGMERAAEMAAGPDEGYLHGCSCRANILAEMRSEK